MCTSKTLRCTSKSGDIFPRNLNSDSIRGCYRGLFIIDEKGILRHITINDMPVGRSVDEAKRVVEAFQFVDKHGEGG